MREDAYFDLRRNEHSFRLGADAGPNTFKNVFDGNGQSLLITLSLICASLFLGGCDAAGNIGLSGEAKSVSKTGMIAVNQLFVAGLSKERASVICLNDCHGAISTAWGGLYIKDFIDRGRTRKAYLQAEA